MTEWKPPTIDEFIANKKARNLYVAEPGIDSIYVRKGFRIFRFEDDRTVIVDEALDIANINVGDGNRGKGNFTRLIARLRNDYPKLSIHVENVLHKRFCKKLECLGFTRLKGLDDCYVILGDGIK